ncbi:hypothetical protein GINT2_001984 [Glugoides intestinalis]
MRISAIKVLAVRMIQVTAGAKNAYKFKQAMGEGYEYDDRFIANINSFITIYIKMSKMYVGTAKSTTMEHLTNILSENLITYNIIPGSDPNISDFYGISDLHMLLIGIIDQPPKKAIIPFSNKQTHSIYTNWLSQERINRLRKFNIVIEKIVPMQSTSASNDDKNKKNIFGMIYIRFIDLLIKDFGKKDGEPNIEAISFIKIIEELLIYISETTSRIVSDINNRNYDTVLLKPRADSISISLKRINDHFRLLYMRNYSPLSSKPVFKLSYEFSALYACLRYVTKFYVDFLTSYALIHNDIKLGFPEKVEEDDFLYALFSFILSCLTCQKIMIIWKRQLKYIKRGG